VSNIKSTLPSIPSDHLVTDLIIFDITLSTF
jgi:hypothetical protein